VKALFVICGLRDMHMHFRNKDRDLKMDVANGVPGIRNIGGGACEMSWRDRMTLVEFSEKRNG